MEQRINKLDIILSELFCTNDGQLYGISNNGGFYTINKTNAEVEFVGETGLIPMFAQSATIDPYTGKCYWAATFPNFTSGLYEVDLTTGEASQFYAFPNGEEITGLYILRNVPADAPFAVENLEVNFQNGSNDGTVSFKMPSKKKNGTPLTGQIDYKLYLNDEIQSGKAAAGEVVNKSVHVETGMCKFVVVASNEAGEGEGCIKSVWIGIDSLEKVVGLTLKKTSKTGIALSWKVPTKGAHGGYINNDEVTYKIVRYPEGVTVQEGKKQISFTEEITKNGTIQILVWSDCSL
ncbi:hypothetical protein [Prevotella sp. OH937_COT-195]|uniref:hypothetical protein n=1 Tax=Prevotella sp. OH937_COT-195 TaxID=2491051 RepID=UPI000F65596B|nr:hypothetical protein [Prevotella sp. OH937_COT-195]RRC99445.1 hypothetical protein EII32_07950 [Prevotella sp. OH937_COT-195]